MWNRVYYSCTSRNFRSRIEGRRSTIFRLFLASVLCSILAAAILQRQNHASAIGDNIGRLNVVSTITPVSAIRGNPNQPSIQEKAAQPDSVDASAFLIPDSQGKKDGTDTSDPMDSAEITPAIKKAQTQAPKNNVQVRCGGHFANSCAECPQGHGQGWCNGECRWNTTTRACAPPKSYVHPDYHTLLDEYPFQSVVTEDGTPVNVILVRSPLFNEQKQLGLYRKYKNDILFLGISSYETFPLSSPNPFTANFSNDKYRGLFAGFLTMMPEPGAYFAPHVKTIRLSQSDFYLDPPIAFGKAHNAKRGPHQPKTYDFTYSGSDQEVHNNCVGWSSFAKNWSFVLEALEVMCSDEFSLTGVLVASKDKTGKKACTIPERCQGKILQTTFLDQNEFLGYLAESNFAFLPQVYDASPRVSTQALSLNVPVLVNDNIVGGWKYVNEKTGEFFHDMSNFRESLRKLLDNLDTYTPLDYVAENYGNQHAGPKLKDFIMEHWGDRVKLPEGTQWLLPGPA